MIDLHLHLDGSMTMDELWFLAQEQHIELPVKAKNALWPYMIAPENCQDLNMYLKTFDLPLRVLQTKEAIQYAVSSLIYRLRRQALLYAEIRFAPQLHTRRGCTQEEIVVAALEGLRLGKQHMQGNMGVGLILCMMRGDGNDAENFETIRLAEKYLDAGICAVDLAGAEALYKAEKYRETFQLVKERNIPFTIHAGEAAGPDSVRAALSFGAKRIGHGVRSQEDPELMRQLADRGTVLELCPSSNVQTRAVGEISSFPIRCFLSFGIRATINTDNMTVSNTTLKRELGLLESECELRLEEKRLLLLNAANASFLTPVKRQQLVWQVSKVMDLQG